MERKGRFSFELPSASSSVERGLDDESRLETEAERTERLRLLHSSSTSPTNFYGSTPSDDDVIPTPLSTEGSLLPLLSLSPSPPSSEASVAGVSPRKVPVKAKSPLSPAPLISTHVPEEEVPEWDYSETEWWGWIILVVTWVVFVVGMGSCLGVWSWAWDVGETPYAPPELEDDPTLPIVGYYPALMVLTAVMSWVWVFFAWLGMKYFKHAKTPVDDI